MAAPKGNQFWKLRSKHGRDKLFSTPELLWDSACEYFEWCDDNPWAKSEAIKSGELAGTIMKVPTARPYTLTALCLYLDCSSSYFREFKSSERGKDEDFMTIITRIEETIYSQKFEGAAIGAFNPNIIARDLGLVDKQDHDHKTNGKDINTNPLVFVSANDLPQEQLDSLIKAQIGDSEIDADSSNDTSS